MAENVFEAVKQSVSTREAAEFYGIKVSRTGMACCPFHDDKNPSMKVDQRFHCFGCGADGDVIDFTAKLFNLSPKEAAEKLAQDFGLIYDSQAPPRRRYVRQKNEAQKFREDRQRCYRVLSDYYYLLKKWEADRSPKTPEEEPHPRFVEAIQKKAYVEYLLDLFLYESEEEQKAWIAEHTAEITHLERRLKIMAENKPTHRERLREITDGIEQGIKELFESEKYMRYLSVMSRFHRYSVNNTMLIYMQKPDATLVAGYNKWKDQFERHVKKGEHGITIIAPTPYKKKIEEQKLDPDTKAPILDKDGKIVTEEKEIEIPMFRPVKVFDVSQTDGKPLPELASSLSGNVPNYEAFMEALRRSAPVPITFEAMAADTDGYFSADHQKIAIRQGMSEVQTVSATVHEIAHSKLHDPKKYEMLPSWKVVQESEGGTKHDFKLDFATEKEAEQFASDMDWRYVDENQFEWHLAVEEDATAEKQAIKNRHTEEVEAESISYAVCKYFGIETGENSFGYIASWSQGKELKELRASLETINKISSELITGIEKHYREICKERGIQIETQEQDTSPEVLPPESAPEAAPPPTPPKEQKPDYRLPLPDPTITPDMAEQCGYTIPDMYPLSKDRAMELLEMVGLPDKANAYPAQLSGGQKQRIAIARALATNPKVLLCDEATSALDPNTTHSILTLIKDINRKLGITVVVITHQMSVVEEICDSVAILDGGVVVEQGSVQEIFANPKTAAAKRLVAPNGGSAARDLSCFAPDDHVVRVTFNGASTAKPLVASLAAEKGILVSVLSADTRDLSGQCYGSMLLKLPADLDEAKQAAAYMRAQPGITVEEVTGE